MTTPYQYMTSPDLPQFALDQKVHSETQLAMPWGDESAHTTLTYLGLAEGEQFERFSIEHQVDAEIDAIYNRESIRSIIFVRRFFAFYKRDKSYFLVDTNKKDAREAFRRLGKANPSPVTATPEEMALERLLELGRTTGGWFAKLKIADVRSAAVFGTETVVESEEWARYLEAGELASIYAHVPDRNGIARSVMLGRDRFVMIMKDMGEGANLDFAAFIQEQIDGLVAGAG